MEQDLRRWSALLQGETSHSIGVRLRVRGAHPPSLSVEGGPPQSFRYPEELPAALEGLFYDRLRRPERNLAVLHAAVAVRRGEACLFTGASGSGKSVLSLDLSQRGWTYLSDELAPIDDQGRVLALPRPVALDEDRMDPSLRDRLISERVHWTMRYPTPGGRWWTLHYLLPSHAAPSGSAWPIRSIFRLEPRAGRRPRLHRMSPAEARAFLAAARAFNPFSG